MRVLQVVHGFSPWAMGGTEVYTHDLSRTLVDQCGAEVFVLTREANPKLPEYNVRTQMRGGIELTIVNNTFAAPRTFEDSYRQPEIRKIGAQLLDRIRPDVVHVQHLTCLSSELPLECNSRGIPTIFTLHDYWMICHRGQLLDENYQRCEGPYPSGCGRCVGAAGSVGTGSYRVAAGLRRLGIPVPAATGALAASVLATKGSEPGMEASAARLRHMREVCAVVTQFLAPSITVRNRFLEFGIPEERIAHHECGIDQSRLAGIARKPGDRLRIGFLGSLMVSKAPHLLLEAFARLPEGSASLHLYGSHAAYHGDDGYRARLDPLLSGPGVHWLGPVPHEQIADVLGALDVLVVPSIWLENSPLVIREAFAAGLPVVVSNLGGMAEMVTHEENGLLFEPGDAGSLGLALTRLVEEPDLLARLRSAVPPVRTIADDADATFALYQSHVTAVRADAPVVENSTDATLIAVVLNYRTPTATERAVRSLVDSQREIHAILVVDNGSGDGSVQRMRETLPSAEILSSPSNLGFSGGCNLGIAAALERGADLVLLVNSDAVLAPDTAERLESVLLADECHGIAVPVLLSGDHPRRIASAGIAFSTLTGRMRHHEFGRLHQTPEPSHAKRCCVVDAGSGCVMLVRREVFERIGTFDDSYFFSFEDVHFCLRARRGGFSTVVASDALAFHEGSLSIGPHSPRKLYFSTRNHLLAAAQTGEANFVGHRTLRAVWIVTLSLAFALRSGGAPRLAGLGSVLRGTWHHLRGRYDDDA